MIMYKLEMHINTVKQLGDKRASAFPEVLEKFKMPILQTYDTRCKHDMLKFQFV